MDITGKVNNNLSEKQTKTLAANNPEINPKTTEKLSKESVTWN